MHTNFGSYAGIDCYCADIYVAITLNAFPSYYVIMYKPEPIMLSSVTYVCVFLPEFPKNFTHYSWFIPMPSPIISVYALFLSRVLLLWTLVPILLQWISDDDFHNSYSSS